MDVRSRNFALHAAYDGYMYVANANPARIQSYDSNGDTCCTCISLGGTFAYSYGLSYRVRQVKRCHLKKLSHQSHSKQKHPSLQYQHVQHQTHARSNFQRLQKR
jgi:hypothetical protein